uniref:Methyltransferase n=1 Tax=Vitis vinifera TaxID=29760 RepID=A5BJG7_VITVI|nr:hypothetical protein VITISV_000268 [Vitis vinifera]
MEKRLRKKRKEKEGRRMIEGVLGTYLLSRNVITLSIAPKDAHENQIQFALERDLPAMVVALVTRRLLYLSQAFDLIHCSRCRINWTCDDGILLLDVNRMLRVGGYFAWAVQSVYKHEENLEMQWKEMVNLTTRLCWQQPYEEAMGDLENKRKLTAPNLNAENPYIRILSFRMLSIIADPHPQPSDFNHKAIGPTDTNPSRSERLNPIHTEPDFEFPPSNPSASIPTLHDGNDVEIGMSNGGLNP